MILTKIIDCIHSFFIDIKILPFKQAVKIPFYVSHRTKIKGLYKGCVIIDGPVKSRMISIGISESTFGLAGDKHSYIMISKNAKMIFHGKCVFSRGSAIRLFENSVLEVGKDAYMNQYSNISVHTKVTLGDELLAGWHVNIQDADGHAIFQEEAPDVRVNADEEIYIGNHVWLASYSDILKGSYIPDNSIVAYKSCVTRKFEEENTILAGVPAKVIKKNIRWHI